MELSCTLVNAISKPHFLVKHSDFRREISTGLKSSWDDSWLNPKNRPNALEGNNSRWRIDGATGCGTCFYAVPMDVPHLVPLQIFVFLCDQRRYPAALRPCLDAAAAVPLRHGPSIARLGISRHICNALDHYCAENPTFLDRYQQFPLGSRLVFEHVSSDVSDMRLIVVPGYEVERQATTIAALQSAWTHPPPLAWPPLVNITNLRLVHQLHDTVSVVQTTNQPGTETIIFKSVSDSSFEHLYHELRFLLTAPSHPNLMPRPIALVTKRQVFGGRQIVVGFLLKRFPQGSIRDILSDRSRSGTLSNRVKLRWSQQVASALLHIHEKANTFFSDLRPDNILLDGELDVNNPSEGNIVLCDFEQRGNWFEWSAPEVLYRQYVENMRSCLQGKAISENMFWTRLLERYTTVSHLATSPCYTTSESPVQAKNRAWFCLSRRSSEKAMVYSLGLLIYTIFEGMPNVSCNIANKWSVDPHIRVPSFKHCPPPIIDIVKRCSPEAWDVPVNSPYGLGEVIRTGTHLHSQQVSASIWDECEAAGMVIDFAVDWWESELNRAWAFTETKEWENGEFGRNRPTLKAVLAALESLTDGDLDAR